MRNSPITPRQRILPTIGLILSCPTESGVAMSDICGSTPLQIGRARHRLPRGIDKASIPRPTDSAITRSEPTSLRIENSFEDRLYAVIAASAVAALLLGTLGLMNSAAIEKGSPIADKPGVTERILPNHGKDGKF
jgi:hypothetical protein